jgi:hypothetical protein
MSEERVTRASRKVFHALRFYISLTMVMLYDCFRFPFQPSVRLKYASNFYISN